MEVEDLGAGLEKFAMEFVDKTRQLKSLVLLRSSQPTQQTDQVHSWFSLIIWLPFVV
jgi:hypothetical protein